MAPTDSKYFRTAERMDQALLRLLERKDFPLITVKELCREAEVSRSTFYLHYETVADLLSETTDALLRQFLGSMGRRPEDFLQGIAARPLGELRLESLVPYLRYLRDHRRIFQTALAHADIFRLEEAYAQLFRHVFTPILDRFQVPEGEREYLVLLPPRPPGGDLPVAPPGLSGGRRDPGRLPLPPRPAGRVKGESLFLGNWRDLRNAFRRSLNLKI